MESAARWVFIAIAALCLPLAHASAQKPEKKRKAGAAEALGSKAAEAVPGVSVPVDEGEVDIEQVREELGVNQFTAPSIEHILAELMDLRPIPIEKLWKDLKGDIPQDRALMALSSGRAIADGLLAVI